MLLGLHHLKRVADKKAIVSTKLVGQFRSDNLQIVVRFRIKIGGLVAKGFSLSSGLWGHARQAKAYRTLLGECWMGVHGQAASKPARLHNEDGTLADIVAKLKRGEL